jgi:histone-lysine N-methyltransferase SETMAR
MEGEIFVHFTPEGETVNSQNYCDVLRTKLKAAVRSRDRGKVQKDAFLLHDNARPHMANQTVKRVNKMGCEQMEHPPRSPDLTPQRFPYVWPNKRSSKRKKNFIR